MKQKSAVLPVAASFLALLWCAPAASARSDSAASKPSARTTGHVMSDAEFAKAAAQGGLAEVKLGELAETKGTAQSVKDFGKRMVTDHSRLDGELKTAANTGKLTLPTELSAKDQALYDHLSKLSGSAFDRAYARDMVHDHIADIAAFRTEAKDGKDTSLKNFASKSLPTLEEHLNLAREMRHEVAPAKTTGTSKKS
jgi:putative membrane protein